MDALIVTRNNVSINQPVVIADDTSDTVLSTHDLDFGWQAGVRAFIGNECCDGSGWEIGYFGVNGRTSSASATDPNNLNIPPPLSLSTFDFLEADTMTISWDWMVNNAEINAFRQVGRVQLLAGFRYFNLEEHFNIRSQDSDSGTSDYTLTAMNNLFGGQLGARTYCDWNRLRIGATGKAGVFGNDAIEKQIVFDSNNTTVLRDAQGHEGAVSFVGDVDLFVSYQIAEHFRLRAGYYWLWATNVALAPDQLDFSDTAESGTHVNDSGNLFLHGATVGLEAAW